MNRGTARTVLLHYGGAVGFTALAVLLRWLLDPWLGDFLPFPTLYGAVALAVWVGGYRPALLATALGFLACDWLFVQPRGELGLDSPRNLLGLCAYLFSCGVIIGFGEAMHAARRRCESRQRELEQAVGQWRQAEQALADFIRCAPFGIAVLDGQMRYLRVNGPLAEMNGIPAQDHVGKAVAEVVPALAATAAAVFQQVMKTGQPVLGKEFEGETAKADGVRRWWEESWFPLIGPGGRPTAVGVIVQEVTERRRAEEALRRATEELRIVTDSMAAPVTRCSRDLKYLWVGKPYADWINRPASEIVGRPIVDVLGPEAFQRLRPYFERVLAGEVVRYEEQVPFRGIGPRWITAVYTPTFDARGACDGWVAVVNDIDQRRRTEEALRASEARFRITSLATGVTLFEQDVNLRYLWLHNPITNYTVEGVVGKADHEISHTVEDLAALIRAKREVLSTGHGTRLEVVNRTAGNRRYYQVTLEPKRDAEGRVVGLLGAGLDVTDRREQEAALRESEERHRRITDLIPFGAWVTDADGNATYLSAQFLDMVGQTLAEHRRAWAETIHPDYAATTAEKWRQFVKSPGVWDHEFRMRGKDGRYRTLLARGFPLRDGEGRVTGFAGINYDITERKRIEEQVRQSAEELQTLLHTLPIGVFLTPDTDCRRITGNPAAYKLLRLPPSANLSVTAAAEERPTHFRVCRDGVEIPPQQLPLQRAARGESVHREENEIAFDDGTVLVTQISATPLIDAAGRVRGAVAGVVDITEQKRTEQRLHASEQRLAAELDAISRLHALNTRLLAADDLRLALDDVLANVVAASGADFGTLQVHNPEVQALEIVAHRGFHQDFLDYFRHVRPEEGSCCAQAMASGRRIHIEDVERDPAFAPHRPVAAAAGYRAVQSTPLEAGDGSVIGILATHFRQPQRLSERVERLLDLYARHAADVILRFRYEQALRDADRRKDEFLATLAHELRNPLAPLRNALQIVKMSAGDPQVFQQTREMMERQLQQLVRLVDDLLDMSRITRNKLELRKQRVELAATVASAVETSRPVIDGGGHELTVALPPEPVYLDADPVRLAQVFANLLNNAAKYTERGGSIRLSAERAGPEVVVSVQDNGIGIAADALPRLFEMFSQVTPALERSQGGLGIGLALVRKLVQLHGGTVEARSGGVGTGSEFIVRLPAVESPAEAARGARAGEKAKARTARQRRILVVDDNRDAADSLVTMLRIAGHETHTAYDGLEAVQAAATFRPDVVLLDIGLPRMNGFEAARHIRAQPWGKGMALLALTGWGQEEDKRRAAEAGFDHHLTKPVDPTALEKLLAVLRVG